MNRFLEINQGATKKLINLDKVLEVEMYGNYMAKFVMDEKTAYHSDMPYETAKKLLAIN